MEGCYKVEENINFESFLRVMGVTEEEQIQRMMAATKEVIVIIILSSLSSLSLPGYPDQQRWRDLDPGVRPQDLHIPHWPWVHGEAADAGAGADLG